MFEQTISEIKSGSLKGYNLCISKDSYYNKEKPYVLYIMGEGAEQMYGLKRGFSSEEEIKDFLVKEEIKGALRWI
jgi:hypothetical protein